MKLLPVFPLIFVVLMFSQGGWAEFGQWQDEELFVQATQFIKNSEFHKARVILTQLTNTGQERLQEKYLLFLSYCNYRLGDWELALRGLNLVARVTQPEEVKIRVDRMREKILAQHGPITDDRRQEDVAQQDFLDLAQMTAQMNEDTKELLRGIYHLKMHNFATALDIFRPLSQNRNIPAANLYMGFIHYLAGNFSLAEHYWRQLKLPSLIALREKILREMPPEVMTKGKSATAPFGKKQNRYRQHFGPLTAGWGYDDNPLRATEQTYSYLPSEQQAQGYWHLQGAYLYNHSQSPGTKNWAAFYQFRIHSYQRLDHSDFNNQRLHLVGLAGEWQSTSGNGNGRWHAHPTIFGAQGRYGDELRTIQGGLDLLFCYRACPYSEGEKWGIFGWGRVIQSQGQGSSKSLITGTVLSYGGGIHWAWRQFSQRLELGQQLFQLSEEKYNPVLLYLAFQGQQLGQRPLLLGGEVWFGQLQRSFATGTVLPLQAERVDQIGKVTLQLVHPFLLNWRLVAPICYQWVTVKVDEQEQETMGFSRWFFQLKIEGSF